MHFNELPLRHLFQHLDGMTTGPNSYCGRIGKELAGCEKLSPANFLRITGNLPNISDEVLKDLSKDQKYLFEICKWIESGSCSPSLKSRSPGTISHARWLTTANRILRLYVSSSYPSKNLITLVTFILNVYAPMWFAIKNQSHCYFGAVHVFNCIIWTRYLPADLKSIVDKVIQKNAFFARTVNLALAMLVDENKTIRKMAVDNIKEARKILTQNQNIRVLKIPQINFNAEHYVEMNKCQDLNAWNPPLLQRFSNETLEKCIETTFNVVYNELKNIPCHSQAVERNVRLVSEACDYSYGEEKREGFIRCNLSSRVVIKKFIQKFSLYKK